MPSKLPAHQPSKMLGTSSKPLRPANAVSTTLLYTALVASLFASLVAISAQPAQAITLDAFEPETPAVLQEQPLSYKAEKTVSYQATLAALQAYSQAANAAWLEEWEGLRQILVPEAEEAVSPNPQTKQQTKQQTKTQIEQQTNQAPHAELENSLKPAEPTELLVAVPKAAFRAYFTQSLAKPTRKETQRLERYVNKLTTKAGKQAYSQWVHSYYDHLLQHWLRLRPAVYSERPLLIRPEPLPDPSVSAPVLVPESISIGEIKLEDYRELLWQLRLGYQRIAKQLEQGKALSCKQQQQLQVFNVSYLAQTLELLDYGSLFQASAKLSPEQRQTLTAPSWGLSHDLVAIPLLGQPRACSYNLIKTPKSKQAAADYIGLLALSYQKLGVIFNLVSLYKQRVFLNQLGQAVAGFAKKELTSSQAIEKVNQYANQINLEHGWLLITGQEIAKLTNELAD